MNGKIIHGDSIEELRKIPDNSIDACVTDPPYELTSARPGGRSPATRGKVMKGFMGMKWDGTGIAHDVGLWKDVLRVLKPGAHLLAFGGTRTYHRMACAIEDSGFEIRDQMQWIYASGFPKSLNISKAIGKHREKIAGTANMGDWDGWGTALKPANEPICVARKPLSEKTVAANVLKWGVGALNIERSRITAKDPEYAKNCSGDRGHAGTREAGQSTDLKPGGGSASDAGRWPSNVILDEEAGKALDEQTGILTSGANLIRRGSDKFRETYGEFKGQTDCVRNRGVDSGGASRFFYCAKASKSERGEGNKHPTVKPIKLMEYLVRLVTPPAGTVLDPFLGSGTTAVACHRLGFECIGIDKDKESVDTARRRLADTML